MNEASLIFNNTLIQCLRKFTVYCFPSCGSLQARDILPACINVSVKSTIQRIQYVLDDMINDQYDLDLAVPMYGYITPILAVITVVFNLLVCCVLSGKSMRSPTNLILISIAVCDTVTILSPVSWYLYTYGANGYKDYPSYGWCTIYRYLSFIIPTCFHNSALWLTVMLSIHRYIGITHPNLERKVCTYKAVIIGIICIFLLILILVLSQLFFESMEKITVIGKQLLNYEGIVYIDTCYFKHNPNVNESTYLTYFKVYSHLRIVLCNILPCILLVIFNAILIRGSYKSYVYRKELLRGSIKSQNSEMSEVVRTTVMLISVCVLTLLVEIPNAISFSLHLADALWNLSVPNVKVWITFPNFILFSTYPAYFILYLTMNRRFRKSLTIPCCKHQKQNGIYSISSSFNGRTLK